MKPLSLVFVPGFNINIIKCHRAESIDESTCQAAIRNQWHIKVNRSTPNFITISQFMHRQVLLNINDQINLSLVQQIQSLWLLSRFRWPVNPRIDYTLRGTYWCHQWHKVHSHVQPIAWQHQAYQLSVLHHL